MSTDFEKLSTFIQHSAADAAEKKEMLTIVKKLEKDAKLFEFKNNRLLNEKASISNLLRKVSDDFNQNFKILEEQKQVVEEKSDKLQKVITSISQSINYAKRIQYALLPSESTMKKWMKNYFILPKFKK